jgi:hypothetical protein
MRLRRIDDNHGPRGDPPVDLNGRPDPLNSLPIEAAQLVDNQLHDPVPQRRREMSEAGAVRDRAPADKFADIPCAPPPLARLAEAATSFKPDPPSSRDPALFKFIFSYF